VNVGIFYSSWCQDRVLRPHGRQLSLGVSPLFNIPSMIISFLFVLW
jgi:hypothetical protein